jgi:diguanylate cyclase (GGDEF)-like protein/PAS domain S-box-containing protein
MTHPAATILIVDDETHNRKLLEALLQPEGYLTVTASNGEEALASIAGHMPDLILLDILMPGMDGYQVVGLLKADPATSNIPIIMVTVQTDRSARLAGLDAGVEDFLTKPVDRAELSLKVRNLLRLKSFNDFLKNHSSLLEQEVQVRTESLHASELRFRQMAENIREVFWLTDPAKSQILYVSPAYAEIWGRSCESLYASPREWIDAIHPGDRERVLQATRTRQAIGAYVEEYRVVRPDGTIRWVRDRAFPVFRNGSEVYRIAGLAEDITESRRVAEELHESERRFSDVLQNVELISLMLDTEGLITYCNEYLLRLTGWRREDVIGRNWFELFIPPEINDLKDVFAALLANKAEARHHENEILTRSGERRLIRWNNSVLHSGADDVIGTASIGEDITEQNRDEIKIKRLNRVYAVLSGISGLIVRVHDREKLFKEACRIAVEQGGFRMAWIGVVDRAAMKIVPVASAGANAGFLEEIRERLSLQEGTHGGYGPAGMAVREKQAVVVNDVDADPRILYKSAQVERGVRSLVVLPLMIEEEPVAVLALHAAEAGYFDDAEMKLLRELAGDVAFAIDHIDKRERLDYLAYYDPLTGLPNRTLFYDTLKKTLVQAEKGGWLVAVLCVDVDHFKNVNDTLGHAIGDELLRQFGNRLVQCVRIRDTVARLGGDEFALILVMQDSQDGAAIVASKIRDAMRPAFELKGHEVTVTASIGITVHQGAARVANKIRDALRPPFDLKGNEVAVTASIGITMHPEDSSDPETLMKYADTAMYRAKQSGRDTFRFFTPQMNAEVSARLELETALRKAVENGEFVLHYQPKAQLASGRFAGVEALLRWQRPGRGLVPPKDFIPLLEDTGLIVRVGSWVIAEACKQIGLWMRSSTGPVPVSVNVSGRQFVEGDLHGDVTKGLADNGIPAELLELELTESSLMGNTERTIASMQNLKKLGVHISIDDFGTGYSSLSYLRRFPLDRLKIDIAFIRDVTSNPDDAAIVLAIIRMAHSLKLDVIAEGVETAAQLAYLRRHGCDLIQGYYFSRPLPLPELEKFLREGKRLAAPDGVPLKTLLLMDDDAGALTALQGLLDQDGYHILSAQSAAEGFDLLAQHRVQVVLCGQRISPVSGTVFLDRVKDLHPDTFRIVLSDRADTEAIVDAINRGAVHRFYARPWEDKILRDKVREAFRDYSLLHDMPQPGAEVREPAQRITAA